MTKLAFAGALMASLLAARALTPVQAADMTFDRALNASKEPQNWLLHHGNFEGYRFSRLKDIITDTVKIGGHSHDVVSVTISKARPSWRTA